MLRADFVMDRRLDTPRRLLYRVDARNRLFDVDDGWDRFALANGAGHLVSARVLGTPLLDHICDETLRELTSRLLDRVRDEAVTIELPFRCDAPGCVREMHMRISPGSDGGVTFESVLVRELARPAVALLDAQADRDESFVRICSWCNRGAVGAEWVELDEMIRRLGLFEHTPVPLITHGLCMACADDLERRVPD